MSRHVGHVTNFMTINVLAALDSNIIIYAEDVFADARHAAAQALIENAHDDSLVLPLQAVGEAMNWLVRRGGVPKAIAAERMSDWTSQFPTQATTLEVFNAGRVLISHHGLQVWDAIILASAAEAGSDMLLSEDMQHGFEWQGVTVINPFLAEPHPMLKQLLKQ